MALRFFLGMFEAAYAPGVIYLFSFFYRRHEIGFRCGMFASAAPLASTFAGALAYGITSGHSKLANWRLLFLVEGLPTLVMAPVAYYLVPDSPGEARFLDAGEKAIAQARAVRRPGTGKKFGKVKMFGKEDVQQLLQTFLDPKAWCMAVRTAGAFLPYSTDMFPHMTVTLLQCQCQLC